MGTNMATAENLALGAGHTMQYTGKVSQKYTLDA